MALDYSIEPFKEPRGFLKLLQWIFAICAFATTVNFTTEFAFSADVKCSPTSNFTVAVTVKQTVEYPFDLDQPSHFQTKPISSQPPCKGDENATKELEINFVGNVRSDSEFFVTTGVLCFLYTTGIIALYLLSDKTYTENPKAPIIDFVITLIFAIFWLSGSAAWSHGLTDLKTGSDPNMWLNEKRIFTPDNVVKLPIHPIQSGAFGGIVISILFGFINFVLWGANLWFLYKETTWFESILKNAGPSASTSTGP